MSRYVCCFLPASVEHLRLFSFELLSFASSTLEQETGKQTNRIIMPLKFEFLKEEHYARLRTLACCGNLAPDETPIALLKGNPLVLNKIASFLKPLGTKQDHQYKVSFPEGTDTEEAGAEHMYLDELTGKEGKNAGALANVSFISMMILWENMEEIVEMRNTDDGNYLNDEIELRAAIRAKLQQEHHRQEPDLPILFCALPGDTVIYKYKSGFKYPRVATDYRPATYDELRHRGWITEEDRGYYTQQVRAYRVLGPTSYLRQLTTESTRSFAPAVMRRMLRSMGLPVTGGLPDALVEALWKSLAEAGEEERLTSFLQARALLEHISAEIRGNLRFNVGQRVLCKFGGESWARGKIVDFWYHEPWMHQAAPYQVELDDGRLISVPIDTDEVICVENVEDEEDDEVDDDDSVRGELRFSVGQHVLSKVAEDTWARGKIVDLWYHEPWMRQAVPYQVELDGGDLIFSLVDDDEVIRAE